MTLALLFLVLALGAVALAVAPGGADYAFDPAGFIDRFLPYNEQGRPWRLSPYQRRVLALAFHSDRMGRLWLRLYVHSEVKKAGKTMVAAALTIWWATTRGPTGVRCLANDFEQSQGRVFATVAALLRHNGFERAKLVRILATEVRFENGSVVRAAASDEKGEAGARDTLNVFDELWAFSSERAWRLWEEATPIPTAPEAWNLVVTTAGFVNESTLLESLYQRGLAGERLDPELEVYRDGEFVMFWSHTPRQPWLTQAYLDEQRRSLRPSTYLRLFENRWVAAESTFITPEQYDRCVDASLEPASEWAGPVFVAADLGIKSDCASVQAVAWDGGALRLVAGRVWRPRPGVPVDLTEIESYLRGLHERFEVASVRYDPWQAHALMARLRAEGLPCEEYPQTEASTGAMGSALYELFRDRRVALYPDADLREHVLNATAIEGPRGFRLAKQKATRKIDAAVALAMASVAALEQGPTLPLRLVDTGVMPDAEEWARQEREAEESSLRERREQSAREIEEAARSPLGWFPR